MKKILPWLPVTLVLVFLVFLFGMDAVTKHSPEATCLFLIATLFACVGLFVLIVAHAMAQAVASLTAIPPEPEAEPPDEPVNTQAPPMSMAESMADAEALAILGDYLLGKNGEIPDTITYERVAIGWAYGRMQYRHAWVVCSPVSDAMGELMQSKEKNA